MPRTSGSTLLPLGPIALSALAVQVHGWELDVRSGYLPHGLSAGWRAATWRTMRRMALSEEERLSRPL
ncbi:Imm49 family immunity protein [Streptomyces cinnamoneus]|uniref:Imm49 family immunity protein n=1 Tax=Streptomyces cinnamoneus TaxID=53446 RepID=UPI003F54417D